MRYIITLVITTAITLLVADSCTFDSEEELYGTTSCDTQNVSYNDDLLPLIEDNCFNCHDADNNNGNVTLDGYDNVVIYVNNNRLMGAIRHDPGFSPMPQGKSQLLECEIEKFQAWVDEGAPNN